MEMREATVMSAWRNEGIEQPEMHDKWNIHARLAEALKRKEETVETAAGRFKDIELLVNNAWSNVREWQDAMTHRVNQRFDSMQARISKAGERVAMVRSQTASMRDGIGALNTERQRLKNQLDAHREDLERLSGMDARVAEAQKVIRESEQEKEALQRTIFELRAEVCWFCENMLKFGNCKRMFLCRIVCVCLYTEGSFLKCMVRAGVLA